MAADTDNSSSPGVGARLTAKVGPLPVWAWALGLLVGGYLLYRVVSAGGSSSTTSSGATTDSQQTTDTAAQTGGDSGYPSATSGQGTSADNLNGELLSQLSGFQTSVDYLTAAIQTSPAFWPGSGDAGSGAYVANDGTGTQPTAAPAAKPPAKPTAKRPAPAAGAKPTVRYYTYAPGKAPKGKAAQAAPARGPAGTKLRFTRGKGYYYA